MIYHSIPLTRSSAGPASIGSSPPKFEDLLEEEISRREAEDLKREWLIRASSVFEPLGCLAYEDEGVVGYIQFSPTGDDSNHPLLWGGD